MYAALRAVLSKASNNARSPSTAVTVMHRSAFAIATTMFATFKVAPTAYSESFIRPHSLLARLYSRNSSTAIPSTELEPHSLSIAPVSAVALRTDCNNSRYSASTRGSTRGPSRTRSPGRGIALRWANTSSGIGSAARTNAGPCKWSGHISHNPSPLVSLRFLSRFNARFNSFMLLSNLSGLSLLRLRLRAFSVRVLMRRVSSSSAFFRVTTSSPSDTS